MGVREKIARLIAPGVRTEAEVRQIASEAAQEAVAKARQAWPTSTTYDPHGEGYRKQGAGGERRDLAPMTQDRMFEMAYYMYDTSGMTRRFVRDTKNFVLGQGVSLDHPSDKAKEILQKFWEDSQNMMDIKLEGKVEFLGLLGEQCWPVAVNPVNGHVKLGYIDPASIKDIHTDPNNVEVIQQVELMDRGGRPGQKYAAIREDYNIRSKSFGRLVGDCFFFAINHPPNSPRGRSDLLPNLDFILTYEEQLFNELDRSDLMKSFVWDVMLKGATDDEIRKWLEDNSGVPRPGSMRVHNESVEWKAVSPQLGQYEAKAFFELCKEYLAGCQNRPASWFGAGGKAYQAEADLMGEPTFADLGSRQRYIKYMIEYVLRFVLDQAVIHNRLSATEAAEGKATANLPEMSEKDVAKIINGVPQLSTALAVAVQEKWITFETAASIFVMVVNRLGVEVDVEAELKAIKSLREMKPKEGEEDYT